VSEVKVSSVELIRTAIREHDLNLSLYFDKYSPVVTFPEILKILNGRNQRYRGIISPSGGLRRLSVYLLSNSFMERAIAEESGKGAVRFFDNVLKGKARGVSTSFQVRLSDRERQVYESFFELWEELLNKRLPPEGGQTFKTTSRLVIGLGDESIYETNIKLMRNYGVPYIPGSALKGVAKHRIAETLQENSEKYRGDFYALAGRVQKALDGRDEDFYAELTSLDWELVLGGPSGSLTLAVGKALELFREVFGTTNNEGTVIFFDALPLPESLKEKPMLELDIMNPHYPNYYQGNEPPGDWQEPKPIFFLTVPEGIGFKVAVSSVASEEKHVDVAFELLKTALSEFGVGAKTALGYGRLELVSTGGGGNR